MEEVIIEGVYEEKIVKRHYMIFNVSTLIANLLGTIANFIIFGASVTSFACAGFSLLVLFNLLISSKYRNNRILSNIVIFSVVTLEVPLLYIGYTLSALPYFVLGYVATIVLLEGRTRYAYTVFLSIVYVIAIVMSFIFPQYSDYVKENSGEFALIASGLASMGITSIVVLLVISTMIHDVKLRNNEYVEMEKKILKLSHYDTVTPCYNRQFVLDYLKINSSNRNGCILMLFDLIDLAYINMKYGYIYGDEVLSSFASIAQDTVKGRGLVSRYDGQKFLIVVNATAQEEAERIVKELTLKFENFIKGNVSEKIYLSYGYTICKNTFSVDDEIRILYAKDRHFAESLPQRKWMDAFIKANK